MKRTAILAAAIAAFATAAQAHVAIVEAEARPGAIHTATFRVSHGCKSQPTTELSIALPPGVTAEAVAKPGWTVRVTPTAIVWTGGRSPEREPDTFAATFRLPATEGPLYFPATQRCDALTEAWDQVPAGEADPVAHPAPVLLLTPNPRPPAPASEHHHH